VRKQGFKVSTFQGFKVAKVASAVEARSPRT
jgi:hypothetical protein